MKPGSILTSRGLFTSEEGVRIAGTGRVGSSPAGYDRGSARLIRDRDELDEAIDAAESLLAVAEEKVEAMDRRDRHDEPEDDVVVELAVVVDMNDDAVELRPSGMLACDVRVRRR